MGYKNNTNTSLKLIRLPGLIKKLKERNYELQKLYNQLNKQNKDFIRKTIDLTEIKNQLEDKNFELESANREITNILKTKTEFVNRVAHDLRTPLAPILILVPLIKSKVKDKKIKHDILIVENNAKYLNQLLSELITLIKREPSKPESNYERLSMSDLIDEVLKNEENVINAHKIRVIREVTHKLPSIIGNRLAIIEVLHNIISNAIKFMTKGGKLKIIAFEKDNFIYVSIKDTGIGMTKKTLSKLFDPFFKADESRHSEGSGLGLSICKKIIEDHNGSIVAQSEGLGKGSTITFYLPTASGG